MKTLVEIIQEVENNISELREEEKKNGKVLKALEEAQQNIMANIAMFEKVLEDLTSTKEKEIEVEMENKPANRAGIHGPIKAKGVNAIDANGEVIAKYSSQSEAARDLHIEQSGVSWRMRKMAKENQLKKFGYALVFA